ncbi:MAG: radical SAM protein, partial [Myxococcales bacterium]|nr:radical SAM protein [Myxococcales bacterium]
GDFSQVPNLHRLHINDLGRTRAVSTAAAAKFQDLDGLIVPDRTLVDPRHYQGYRIDSVQTKRGCSLKCDYCTYPVIEGRTTRRRTPALIVDEMFGALRQQPDMRHVFIVDSVFNLPPSHAKEICRQLITRRWPIAWTAYANPLAFDRELADLMVQAGCAGIEIGADSGVERILLSMKKGFTLTDVAKMHATCAAAGLRDCMTYILGTPGESLEDVRQTLDFCTNLSPFAAIMMVWMDDYESLDAELAAQRRVFREQIRDFMGNKAQEFPRWIIPALGVNFDAKLFAMLRHAGKAGPLWQYIDMIGGDARSSRLRRQARAKAA